MLMNRFFLRNLINFQDPNRENIYRKLAQNGCSAWNGPIRTILKPPTIEENQPTQNSKSTGMVKALVFP